MTCGAKKGSVCAPSPPYTLPTPSVLSPPSVVKTKAMLKAAKAEADKADRELKRRAEVRRQAQAKLTKFEAQLKEHQEEVAKLKSSMDELDSDVTEAEFTAEI